MTDLYLKSLNSIELPSVLEMLSQKCVSDLAKTFAKNLLPVDDLNEVEQLLLETSDAKRMMETQTAPSFSKLKDVRSSLARADLGGMLNTRELMDISGVLQCARSCASYGKNGDCSGRLYHLFSAITTIRSLEDKIDQAITGEEEIADSASPELADIRRKMRAASSRVRDTLQKIISAPSNAKVLQEAIITQRNGRYVVPVRAEKRNSIPGLVHDVSSSGATLFVEPMGAVKANNELRELAAKEKAEIERILMELSAECAANRASIDLDVGVLAQLDLVFAKAELSYDLKADKPQLSKKQLVLKKARHPLLSQKSVVPISLSLGLDYDTIVITGPNTGGKTVALKTIGLLCAMTACGLHVPAEDGTIIPVMNNVLADIGDEQSIEQSLSTFSGHMKTIVQMMSECTPGTLVLFDELGAGTDPTEGAALAMAIIEHCRQCGCLVVATTHYAELKIYASNNQGVMNASCEFDVNTLCPTYRLLIGIPGKSNAFAISSRLGLSEDIIRDARNRLSAETTDFEKTIENLEKQRILMEKEVLQREAARKLAEDNARTSERLRRELEVRLEKAEQKARREAEMIIQEAREAANEAFREIDREKSARNDELEHQKLNEARSAMRHRLNEAEAKIRVKKEEIPKINKESRPIKAGDVVELSSGGIQANVISVNPDGTLVLQAGIMKVSVSSSEVSLVEKNKIVSPKGNVSTPSLRTVSVSPELDIRGFMADEAELAVERYLDSASAGKLKTVTIIHGKGTGALRAAVHRLLKGNRLVKNYRLGLYGEGESGVTVVELK